MSTTPNAENPRTYTKREIAEYLQLTTRSIENHMRTGRLPFWRLGRSVRFDLEQVKSALNRK